LDPVITSPVVASAPTRSAPAAGGVREVARLAYPIVLTQMSQTVMHVVDSIFVGRLGAAELGALGFAGIWLWTVFSVFSGTATGVQTFVSQAWGAGNEKTCGRFGWQGLYAIVPASIVAVVLFVAVAEPIWHALGATAEVREHALAYAHIRPFGFAGLAVWMVLASFFRGVGDTRTPLVATIVANVTNAVLAYGLVLGRLGLPAWGVAGAAVATSLAEWVGAALLTAAFLSRASRARFGTEPVRPDANAIRRFLRTGAPIGGQWFLDMAAFALFTSLVARMGNASMAATQAMISLLSLSFMQAVAISVSSGTLVGRYLGAGDPDAAARSYASAMKLALLLGAAVAALFLGAPELLMRVFSSDPEVLVLARPLLMLGAFFQVVDAIGIVAGGTLRGAGDTRWPFLVHATLAWAARLPFVWVLAVWLEGGVFGAWIGELGYITLLGLAFVLRFRSGVWKTMQP